MKLDQVGHYVADAKGAAIIKRVLGLEQAVWVTDTVTANVHMHGGHLLETNVAELQFCEAMGMQFELLRYIRGPHWLQHMTGGRPFHSHIGFHLEEGEPWPDLSYYFPCVQEAVATAHTNPELLRLGKTYQYRIHQVNDHTYWKFIRRIHAKEDQG